MADTVTKNKRSYIMSRIKRSKTKPELVLRAILKGTGLTYQPKGVYGNPDFADKKKKVVIFVNGCFWHGCPIHYEKPKSNVKYWASKIKRNRERDATVNAKLEADGWRVIRIWEHQIGGQRKADRQSNKQ
jgi:DNA mismatch endonuclease (patch repair protein)